jgi:hypothetical protein
MNFPLQAQSPGRQSCMRNADYATRPLCLRIEIGMAEKTAHEGGNLVLADIHHDQAITPMPQSGTIETRVKNQDYVACGEGR